MTDAESPGRIDQLTVFATLYTIRINSEESAVAKFEYVWDTFPTAFVCLLLIVVLGRPPSTAEPILRFSDIDALEVDAVA